MKIYKTLFVIIFKFLKTFEGGWAHQTDGHRAFESVLGITVLLFINSLVFFPDLEKGSYTLIVIISLAINYVFFIPKKRYLVFLEEQKNYSNRGVLNTLTISYSIITLLSMIYVGSNIGDYL